MAEPVWVELGERRYPVVQVPGGAPDAAFAVDKAARPGRLLLLSDSNVGPLHAHDLELALHGLGRTTRRLEVPAGEGSKSAETLVGLWNAAFEGPIERTDTVVAIGGGVIGDLGGLLASTLLRGLDVVQVATTVLAMSDAAIGGKTGINLSVGKNLVGTFHQPRAVVQWTGSLATLPDRELRSGLAEVVKSALLAGEAQFARLEELRDDLTAGSTPALTEAVRMSAALKAAVVASDEREGGLRRILNFGHTLAHVIEHASGYGTWTHGEAVSAGMILALRLGIDRGVGSERLLERTHDLLVSQKLPVEPPSLTLGEWTGPLSIDKKRAGDSILFVLCEAPGSCRTVPIPVSDLVDWLSPLC